MMAMALMIDSHAVIELFRGTPRGEKVRSLMLDDPDVYISAISLYETGTFLERLVGLEQACDYVRSIITHFNVVDLTEEHALAGTELRRQFTLPTSDSLIYASARDKGAKVVSGCAHFRELSGQVDIISV